MPKEVRHDKPSFEALVHIHAQAKQCFLDEIDINMQQTAWFDADMCAVFGAILYDFGVNLNTINLIYIPKNIESVLSKNGFLSHYGGAKMSDNWRTTISYRRFDVKDDRYFAGYVEDELISRPEIPGMSSGLAKKFRESIFEIFSNAVIHSQTEKGIFSCGQFFPKKKVIDFTVTDLGVGISKNVQNHVGGNLSPERAIRWATEGNNTTKRGRVPGGLGLKLLREFIDLNGGCIRIVSDAGYWQRKGKRTEIARLSHPFPGTVVSVEINTADKNSYSLGSELDMKDIF